MEDQVSVFSSCLYAGMTLGDRHLGTVLQDIRKVVQTQARVTC